MGDYNGDGLSDFGALYKTGEGKITVWGFLSNGTSMTPKTLSVAYNPNCWDADSTLAFRSANVNGNYKIDILTMYNYGSGKIGILSFLL